MDFEIENGDDLVIATVDWTSEQILGDNGSIYWEVSSWWVTHIDGKKVDKAEAAKWEAELDGEYVEEKISEWEAGQ
jgi:hypothetical protein